MGQLHIVLFPFMAHGHMIPTFDMAKMFISRGLKATIIATAPFLHPIDMARKSGLDIGLTTLQFPPKGSSLPDNITSLDKVSGPDMLDLFIEATVLLQESFETLLRELNPNCLVSDMFLPWTAHSAAKLGIPRLLFHGSNCFSQCFSEQVRIHKPHKNVGSDSELFVVPGLPHRIEFIRTQMDPYDGEEGKSAVAVVMEQARDSMELTYGVVVNTFYELEPAYVDHYRKAMKTRVWHIGPLVLCRNGNNNESKAERGKKSTIDKHACSAWLDSKKPNSIVYMCFGSTATYSRAQLHEMAVGLEASGQDFIWVIRKDQNSDENEEWMPEKFEERMEEKGLIIRGWAPQLMILDHPAVGAFVTHCGWNSILEAICAGVPMVTWPVFAEQFFNEKFVTEVLKTGISVGNKNWQIVQSEGVPNEALAKAIKGIMVDEAGLDMRDRAKSYQDMARKAGGSSYSSLDALIQELSVYQPPKSQSQTPDDFHVL